MRDLLRLVGLQLLATILILTGIVMFSVGQLQCNTDISYIGVFVGMTSIFPICFSKNNKVEE